LNGSAALPLPALESWEGGAEQPPRIPDQRVRFAVLLKKFPALLRREFGSKPPKSLD